MVKGFFDQLGCQQTKVYDVGLTEWGQQGNPVVYAKCDEGAEKTVVIYWMYDTMPITQPDLWKAPPFEGRLVEQAPYKKVLIGRGAVQLQRAADGAMECADGHQGGHRQAAGESHLRRRGRRRAHVDGLPQVRARSIRSSFKGADAMYRFGGQDGLGGGSEGCVSRRAHDQRREVGTAARPTATSTAASSARSHAPAWRHIKMLSTLDRRRHGNKVLIDGFYDNIAPLTKEEDDEAARCRPRR